MYRIVSRQLTIRSARDELNQNYHHLKKFKFAIMSAIESANGG